MGGGLRAGRPGRARGAGLRVTHGAISAVLPRSRAVRKRAPFSRPQRAHLGELVGGSAPSLRQGTAAPRYVSSAKIFQQRSMSDRPRLGQLEPIADAKGLAGFRGGDAGVYGQAIKMVEAGGGGPGRQSFAAQVAETFLEAGQVGAGLRVACGNGAAGARIAPLEIDFADAEAHHAAFVFTVELI